MAKTSFEKSSGNVFADIGFTPAEAAELTAKSGLIIAIKDTIERRKLTQQEAARLCGTNSRRFRKCSVAAWRASPSTGWRVG
jgi:predicted XRE-type DNA-binding protein